VGLRAGQAIARVVGDAPLRGASRAVRGVAGSELIPEWGQSMPRAARPSLPPTARKGAAAVYLPACINRIFGVSSANPEAPSLPEALVRVSERAGLPVWIPPDVPGSCCGTPWASKGYGQGHRWMANRMVERLWRWSGEGELATIIDASSCTHALLDEIAPALDDQNRERHGRLEVIDAVSWARDRLVPRLVISRKLDSVAVHPTCGGRHIGLDRPLRALVGDLAESAHVPPSATCCGFAGDRGLLHPELTEAATLEQAAEVGSKRFDAYVSSNRTCEIGLERATGEAYVHVIQLLEELTR
jgi:D-lactate dehydrogenase